MDKKVQKLYIDFPSVLIADRSLIIQNADTEFRLERFQDDLEALSGKQIQQLAGYRFYLQINYDTSLQVGVWRSFCNDIYTEFVTNKSESISVGLSDKDGSDTGIDKQDVIITNESLYRIQTANQINTFVPSISFKGLERLSSIPSWYLF